MGGAGCVAKVRAALTTALARRGIDAGPLDPWYFPTAEDYGGRLRHTALRSTRFRFSIARPSCPGALTAWLETFGEPFTSALPPSERDSLRHEVEDALRPDALWR